jgi:hypothetical protein
VITGWYKEFIDACPASARRVVFGPVRIRPKTPDPLRPGARDALEKMGAWVENDPRYTLPQFGEWIVETIRASSAIAMQSNSTRSLATESWSFQKFIELAPAEFTTEVASFARVADHYFGQRTLPVGATLMLSNPKPPSPNTAEDLHFDGQLRRVGGTKGCLKVFVAAHDVGLEHGPLSFLDAGLSQKVSEAYSYKKSRSKKRITDDEAQRALGTSLEEKTSKWITPQGGLLWLDTDRCLHFGSRSVEQPRYLIQFEFTRPEGLDAILNRKRVKEDRRAIDRISI